MRFQPSLSTFSAGSSKLVESGIGFPPKSVLRRSVVFHVTTRTCRWACGNFVDLFPISTEIVLLGEEKIIFFGCQTEEINNLWVKSEGEKEVNQSWVK